MSYFSCKDILVRKDLLLWETVPLGSFFAYRLKFHNLPERHKKQQKCNMWWFMNQSFIKPKKHLLTSDCFHFYLQVPAVTKLHWFSLKHIEQKTWNQCYLVFSNACLIQKWLWTLNYINVFQNCCTTMYWNIETVYWSLVTSILSSPPPVSYTPDGLSSWGRNESVNASRSSVNYVESTSSSPRSDRKDGAQDSVDRRRYRGYASVIWESLLVRKNDKYTSRLPKFWIETST